MTILYHIRFDSTYEGLKLRSRGRVRARMLGFDSTYEGLKHYLETKILEHLFKFRQ